jgi:hypothetical protein
MQHLIVPAAELQFSNMRNPPSRPVCVARARVCQGHATTVRSWPTAAQAVYRDMDGLVTSRAILLLSRVVSQRRWLAALLAARQAGAEQ